jgi:hypothetical protein
MEACCSNEGSICTTFLFPPNGVDSKAFAMEEGFMQLLVMMLESANTARLLEVILYLLRFLDVGVVV